MEVNLVAVVATRRVDNVREFNLNVTPVGETVVGVGELNADDPTIVLNDVEVRRRGIGVCSGRHSNVSRTDTGDVSITEVDLDVLKCLVIVQF
ncbi:hypothetical protein [Halorubellus sp. JP-L1]|uniref:hypothetical protein n=1 Tax=Halorubellus sp. JP-L1 TaxID=2715753 RepID=UPI001F04A08F|nr:hypothetical protein [Halorubellus sp. JP-L1]